MKRESTSRRFLRASAANDKSPATSSARSGLADALSRRFWLLNSQKLVLAAQRCTRLQDFGSPSLEPVLSVLTNSLESEANLHPLGRFLMHVHLRGLLETRLRLTALWRSEPQELAPSPVQRPIFITGMPRSGSTYLHELLSQDPHNRVPRVWEVMFPVPKSNGKSWLGDRRVARAAFCLWWFRRLAPQADAVFPMRAGTPHECVAIHSYSFLSEEFISTCRVPTYESFLRQADLRPAYSWQRRFLQHLQRGGPSRRWILKSPDHVHGLEALFATFPDALVIHTHRNPVEVLKSSCQLTHVLQGLYARRDSRHAIAARESRLLANSVEKFTNFRDRHPELADRFVDVKYTDLVSDPIVVLRAIYTQFGISLTHTAVERMRALVGARTRYAKPRKLRPLGELGNHVAQDVSRFEQYCSRFGISWQTPLLQ
jgi:hypothetical protein